LTLASSGVTIQTLNFPALLLAAAIAMAIICRHLFVGISPGGLFSLCYNLKNKGVGAVFGRLIYSCAKIFGVGIYRFKQFWFGVFSRYGREDATFTRSYLNIKEMALFDQLPYFEKKHSVIVARKMMAAARLHPELDQRKLIRLGLLHDIGKIAEKNSLLTKALMVIIRFFCPWLYDRLADSGEKHPLWRRFYIHKHHGAVGAELLEKIGESSEILSIIAKHDPRIEPLGPNTPLEQRLLNEADSY
jgi:putative nucleotidyltransferase with HDIG domain